MVTWTRRHFQQVADDLRDLDTDETRGQYEKQLAHWEEVFAGDNPRFDRERFRKAARR